MLPRWRSRWRNAPFPLPSSFPLYVTVTPEATFSGRERDGIVPPARRTDRPRPIVESWQFPFSAAFYGKKERSVSVLGPATHSLLSWNRSWPNLYLAFYLCHGILQTPTYHTRCLLHLGYNVHPQLLSIKILYCHSFPPQFESTVGSHLAPKANQRLPHEISNCGGKLV